MEISYNELKKKEVVNTVDGKKLGHICDLVFSCPENRVQGFVVPGGRAFGFRREEYFIDLKSVVKIGEDVILVNVGARSQRPTKNPCGGNGGNGGNGGFGYGERRSFEEME